MSKYIASTLLITFGAFIMLYLLVLIDPTAIFGVSFVFIFLISIVIVMQMRIIELLKKK
ncbi:hypothetical protein [Cytobacillus solani]|uniref:hypothetical protein n=1 Tax=Cytobacillus solani TaxID=1637975 RepID=UPI000A67DDB2|nr:hypothetical protein [Cytobacillus solani]